MTDRHFLIPSFDQIIPIEAKTREALPPSRKIANLLQSDHSLKDVSRVIGTVTQLQKGGFYLRDETASTFVYASGGDIYPAGSQVEVEGFANVSAFRPILRASRVKLIEKGEHPAAQPLKGGLEARPNLHNELVTIDCEFLTMRESPRETILQCRSGDAYFEAWLPKSDPILSEIKSRDILRLTGIYEVTTTHPIPRIEWANGFRMNLDGPDAITILKRAPWWSLDRLLWALGIAVAAILLILVWTNLLRRRVAIQTKIISRQVERSAIKDERQRIARELHDTLEQDLTGLSMQLENALDEIGTVNGVANRSLTLAHRMLQHSRLEAHASVSDLRNPKLLMRPLAEAMQESLEEKAQETGVSLDFSVQGAPRILRSTTQNHLLRIAREALNNAHCHGKASRVHCHLAYSEEGFTLKLEDNGSGFDAGLLTPAGHFGLIGMRERANKIHARFSLSSTPGHGTTIEVHMPYTSPEAGLRERKSP